MDIKLSFLSFLIGLIMKLQDDLNDNNLFEYFNILKEKDYINHFLIGVFYICWIIFAFKEPVYFSGVTLFFIFVFFIVDVFYNKKEFKAFDKPFESTCLIISIILLLYLLFFENLMGNTFDALKKNYLILCDKDKYIYYILLAIINIINIIYEYYLLNIEYSYKKLIVRFLFLTATILFVITKDIIPNIFYGMVFTIGYYITSCIFQIILIRKDIIEKSLKKAKKEKKSLKKAKKEKKLLKIQQINTS
jgi:hypothetical protein